MTSPAIVAVAFPWDLSCNRIVTTDDCAQVRPQGHKDAVLHHVGKQWCNQTNNIGLRNGGNHFRLQETQGRSLARSELKTRRQETEEEKEESTGSHKT